MTDLETAIFNVNSVTLDVKNVDISKHIQTNSSETVQKKTENNIETVNVDEQYFSMIEKLADSLPNNSNDNVEISEKNKVQIKRQASLVSDSEEEQGVSIRDIDGIIDDNSNVQEYEAEQSSYIKVQKKRINLIDSGCEDEASVVSKEINKNSNSELAEDFEKKNFAAKNDFTLKKKPRLLRVYDSDSDDNLEPISQNIKKAVALKETENTIYNNKQDCLQMRRDSESSADESEQHNQAQGNYKESMVAKNFKFKIKAGKSKKNAESCEKKITGKEALEQRRQIKSESQRMLRQSRVPLPYHRPKSHTLQEFLQRRSRLDDVIEAPPNTPTTFAIKMSTEQLVLTAKRLEEREKEIEEFYKSDTESEEEEESINEVENKIGNEQQESKENETLVKLDNTNENINMDVTVDSQNSELVVDNFNNEENVKDNNIKEKINIEMINELSHKDEINKKEIIIDKMLSKELRTEKNDLEAADSKTTEQLNSGTINESDIEKFVDNGIDSSDKRNNIIHPVNFNDENSTDNHTANTNITITTSSNINQINSKREQDILEEKKATESKLEQKLKKLKPLLALKTNFQPRLSGGPNDYVILDEGLEKCKGVNTLMHRFLAHTAKKTFHKKTEVSIMNVENGVIHQETINLVNDEDEDETKKKMQIPGAKFKKLREELEEQIAKKRIEEWRKRQEEKKLDNEIDGLYDGEKTECGIAEPTFLDDEEEEMTESESAEEEEDIVIKENPRMKSAFVDDEAEQSNDTDDEGDYEEDKADEDKDEDDVENENEKFMEKSARKPLKRIISTFNEDSDEDTNHSESASDLQKSISSNSIADMFASQETKKKSNDSDDNDIPVYQLQRESLEKTPNRNMSPTQNKPDLSFLTPIAQLTGLQGMPSASKLISQESPLIHLYLPPEPSPLKSYSTLKTNLFGNKEYSEFDSKLDELEDLCSGEFASSDILQNKNLTTEEADLLGVCSGRFTGLTALNTSANDTKSNEDILEKNSDDNNLILSASQEIYLTSNEDEIVKEIKTQDKLTFETGINSNARQIDDFCVDKEERNITGTQTQVSSKSTKETIPPPKFVIASSSDEESEEEISSVEKEKLKEKRRKYIIDDISITDEDEFEDREENFNENEDFDDRTEETDRHNINYDSEENEINLDELEERDEENVERIKKARYFFDAEAEISGSDWGSADEDERDLDDLDIEEGDMEKINEKKMQRELGRMHALQVLDEDKREVRLLQELLLEDGELHGAGRERKFRWKNVDSMTWNTDDKPKDEDEDCEEIESESHWRKMRHERELFLKEEQLKKSGDNFEEDENLFGNHSQIMKLGHAALMKSMSSGQSQKKASEVMSNSPTVKLPFELVNTRGSFLNRSDTSLARLAQITRGTSGLLNTGPKNSRNFVFTTVDKTDALVVENVKKRKAEERTPKILKKMRIVDMSPGLKKLKKKLPQKFNL